jgi:hypothetical protein
MSRYTRLILIAAAIVALTLIGWQLLGGGYFAGSH